MSTLYKIDANGNTRFYKLEPCLVGYSIVWGVLDGKTQVKDVVVEPKNIGKKNATTLESQTALEIEAQLVKKQKSGWKYSLETDTAEVLLPMKISTFQKHGNKLKEPFYESNKLDGHNSEYRLIEGIPVLLSRTGGIQIPLPHLELDALKIMKQLNTTSLMGELYIHGKPLNEISSLVKKCRPESANLEFHIFHYLTDLQYSKVQANLADVVETSHIKTVEARLCLSKDLLEERHKVATDAGYEGLVLYNLDSVYEYNKRSTTIQKYKKTLDDEFKIIGTHKDRNLHLIYTCVTAEGKEFKVKRKGSATERLLDATTPEKNIGKWLTVEYEKISAKSQVPLKPVGINIRNLVNSVFE